MRPRIKGKRERGKRKVNSKFSYSKEEEERRKRENEEARQYIKKLMSNTAISERSEAIEKMEHDQGVAEGQYFQTNKFGVYDVLPKRYRDSQSYQDMSKIFSGVDISDRTQREKGAGPVSISE